jgi:hypothetical protein
MAIIVSNIFPDTRVCKLLGLSCSLLQGYLQGSLLVGTELVCRTDALLRLMKEIRYRDAEELTVSGEPSVLSGSALPRNATN